MFGELNDTQLNPGMVYVLAECPQCRTHYAVAPNPLRPGQWFFYQLDQAPQSLSHICNGGLFCLRAHSLLVTHPQAVLTQAGDWLNAAVPAAQPVLN